MENKPPERWHGAHHYSNKLHLLFIFFLLLAAATLFWSYFTLNYSKFASKISPSPTPITTNQTPTPRPKTGGVFCTQEAKQCPDGTWVGRSGPNCEFVCPLE